MFGSKVWTGVGDELNTGSLCFFKESGEHFGELRLWNCEKKEAARSRSGSEEQEKVSAARWVTPPSTDVQLVSGDTLSKDGYGITSFIIRFALCIVML